MNTNTPDLSLSNNADSNPGPSPAALFLLDPALQATNAIAAVRPTANAQADLIELATQLKHLAATVRAGDLQHPESMAIAQAATLNIMFSRLTEHAMIHIGAPCFESLMRLALRAQHQSLRAIDTLSRMKRPSVVTTQVNVAHQQVVSNGPSNPTPPHPLPPPSNSVRIEPRTENRESRTIAAPSKTAPQLAHHEPITPNPVRFPNSSSAPNPPPPSRNADNPVRPPSPNQGPRTKNDELPRPFNRPTIPQRA